MPEPAAAQVPGAARDEARRQHHAYLALGANLGDREAQLRQAVDALALVGTVTLRSSLYETAPVGGPAGQPAYLNAVVLLDTHALHADPRTLMAALLEIERGLGRERRERWGPRKIDLDLLDLGGRMFMAPEKPSVAAPLPPLQLPHPRLAERAFVLAPLAEVAPDWRHPVLRTSATALLQCLDQSGVVRLGRAW